MGIDLSLNAEGIEISPNGIGSISLSITSVKQSDVLDYFAAKDAANHFDHDELLEFISEDTVKGYFELVPASDLEEANTGWETAKEEVKELKDKIEEYMEEIRNLNNL